MRYSTIKTTAVVLGVLLASIGTVKAEGSGGSPRKEVASGLFVGDMLDETNWKLAEGLLPHEILRHYEKGEYRDPIVDYPADYGGWEEAWLEASEENAKNLDVDDEGTIIDKRTGEQPAYFYGFPFPSVDPDDPKAAVKIVWNHFLGYWYGGNSYNTTMVVMLTRGGVERKIDADGWFQFFDGQRKKDREENPLNLQSRFMGIVLAPADLQGTASLTWRYRDPRKRDSVWAYVPALRRVRAVSPANRSDGYLGSDISGDDGFGFDGKPQDFEWTLKGRKPLLRLVDPRSLKEDPPAIRPLENGGWEIVSPDGPPSAGFQVPDWTGIPWAPANAGRAKRDCWVIEAKPKDKYYLYGSVELWVDSITWDGSLSRKYDWKGELVGNYELSARINHRHGPEDDPEWIASSTLPYACAENIKMNRATVSGLRSFPNAPYERRQPIRKGLFDPDTLSRVGK